MRGYQAIGEWVDDLRPKVLQRFRVRRRDGQYRPPSLSAIRHLLIQPKTSITKSAASTVFSSERVPSVALDRKAGVGKDGIPPRQPRRRGARAGSIRINARVYSAASG